MYEYIYVVSKRGLEGARGIRALKHTVLHVRYLYYEYMVILCPGGEGRVYVVEARPVLYKI
jgi:hypothetical protein